ncbi:unnamed protein product [Didymodactylos carnosus]|uniref:Transposase n=1 Tax=Didymodactylos carnosus TaxID=1234261 RepID=A0A815A9A4_9BILA|nr:unnamed protein product [Didymodactylos carnosus]CAF4025566.1 unnamed protein product [Didymodactylos carnosus]
MIRDTGTIQLSCPPGRSRVVRTSAAIQKVKSRLRRKKNVSVRKLSRELNISRRTVGRILKNDLKCHPYKKIIEPKLTDSHKAETKKFANWIFDINGVYNSQNDRIWAVDRAQADTKGGRKQVQQFPQKVMVWLGACSKGVTPLVILDRKPKPKSDKGTVDHVRYIQEVLPVALAYGNEVFGDHWMFQQDGAGAHKHQLTQNWCRDHFPSFITEDRWPANSPDLNPLDYSIWDEFVHAINWGKVTSKKTLIEELKRAVRKIRPKIVLESCNSWTVRLLNVCKNDGNYLR